MGYRDVVSMSGGFEQWKSLGLPWTQPALLSDEQKRRYSRHLLIPEVGAEGQVTLLGSKALLIGAGGLGSPAALYLAAAGVGTIGIVDFDVVDLSNLQRQVIHTTDRLGEKKVVSAAAAIHALNPDVEVIAHDEVLGPKNVEALIAGYDVILDGTDTFETRYTLNDAAVAAGIPVIHASVFRFEGQLTTFVPFEGPCYRCLYPTPPPPELAPGCSVAGRAGCRARDHGPAPGERGDQGAPRDRRHAGGAAAALRRARRLVHRAEAAPRPGLPGLLRCRGGGSRGRSTAGDPGRGRRGRGRSRLGLGARHGGARLPVPRAATRVPGVSTVRIPPVLRAQAGGAKTLDLAGATVGAVLDALIAAHPGLRAQLFTDDGALNRFVNVYVDGQDVRYTGELSTAVGERNEVVILPAMAGGAG